MLACICTMYVEEVKAIKSEGCILTSWDAWGQQGWVVAMSAWHGKVSNERKMIELWHRPSFALGLLACFSRRSLATALCPEFDHSRPGVQSSWNLGERSELSQLTWDAKPKRYFLAESSRLVRIYFTYPEDRKIRFVIFAGEPSLLPQRVRSSPDLFF